MADDNDDVFAQAFAQIAAEDAKVNAPPEKKPPVVPSVSAADNQPAAPAAAAAVEPAATAAAEITEFEVPAKTVDELIAEADAALAAAQTPEEKTAAEALKVGADKAKADAAAAISAAKPAQPQPSPNQEFLREFAETMKEAIKPQPQPQAQPRAEQPRLMSDEEAALLAKYDEEYPDIARAEFIRRRVEYSQLAQYIMNEIASGFAPMAQMVQAIAERVHLGDIQTSVPDYGQVREDVVAWADKQPPYLRAAYQHVVANGTREEVVDLINRWRADTGRELPTAQPNGAAAPNGVVKPKGPTPEARAAAAALAPVQTKRTGAVQAEPTTFDDAFDKFSKELAG